MEYKPSKNPSLSEECDEGFSELSNNGYKIKSAFFTPEVLKGICERLISHFLVLTQDDLALWDADPEEYLSEDGGDSWRYSYRPCCETVFLTIFHQYR